MRPSAPDHGEADPVHPRESALAGVAKGLVDLSFRRSIVADGAGLVYALWIAVSVLQWIGWIILSLIIGLSASNSSYWDDGGMRAPWLPVLVVLLGWIPALLQIVVGRAVLELLTAAVRSAVASQRTVELLERGAGTDGRPAPAPLAPSPAAPPVTRSTS